METNNPVITRAAQKFNLTYQQVEEIFNRSENTELFFNEVERVSNLPKFLIICNEIGTRTTAIKLTNSLIAKAIRCEIAIIRLSDGTILDSNKNWMVLGKTN